MLQPRTIYACADGTDLVVDWESSEDAECLWQRDGNHWPLPVAPLEVAFRRLGRPATERAVCRGRHARTLVLPALPVPP